MSRPARDPDAPQKPKKKRKRIDADAYYTEEDHAITCAALLDVRPGMRVLEGSAGRGDFVRALHYVHGVVPTANELRPEAAAQCAAVIPGERVLVTIGRFEDLSLPEAFDVVLGNPPYKLAQEHVEHGMYLLRRGGQLGYLLRINFLASQKRVPFFRRFPPWRVYVLPERPDFTGEGGDQTEYAFFVWRKGYRGPPQVLWVSTKPENRLHDVEQARQLDNMPELRHYLDPYLDSRTPNGPIPYLQATP